MRREVRRELEGDALVPRGLAAAGVVGAGGGAAGGIEVGDGVGAEIAAAPVDVLQVLARDDGDLQIHGLGGRPRRGGHRRGRGLVLRVGVLVRGERVLLELVRVERGG